MKTGNFLITVLLFIAFVEASEDFWEHQATLSGPPGRIVLSIEGNQGYLFTGTADGDIYRSTDNGNNWKFMYSVTDHPIHDFLISPDGFLYIATYGAGIFQSDNKGETWKPVNTGLSELQVYALTSDTDSYLYAGTENGLFKSSDHGNTWTLTGDSLMSKMVIALALDSHGNLYAGTESSGIYRSGDNGLSWQNLNTGLTERSIHTLHIGADDGIYCVAGNGRIFYWSGSGGKWDELSSPYPYTSIIISGPNGELYAGTHGDEAFIYRSMDGGNSWTNLYFVSGSINEFYITPFFEIIAVTDDGIYRSPLAQNSWEHIGLPLSISVRSLLYSPDGILYAGTELGIYLSEDEGDNWRLAHTYHGHQFNMLAIDNDGTIYAGSQSGTFRSSDKGNSWSQVDVTSWPVSCLAISPEDILYQGEFGGGIKYSIDQGEHWATYSTKLSDSYITAMAINTDGNFFAATATEGFYYSFDKGESWQPIQNGPPTRSIILSLTISPSGRFFASTNGWGVYVSDDGGINWSNSGLAGRLVSSFVFPDYQTVWAVAYCGDGAWLDGSCTAPGVYYSNDSGLNWHQMNTGLTEIETYSLVQNTSGNLFVGTYGGQIFKSRSTVSGINKETFPAPKYFELKQNSPNPFNGTTAIVYTLQRSCDVQLDIYDITGKKIRTLVNTYKNAGEHYYTLTMDTFSSGVYIYRLKTGEQVQSKKMLLLK